MAYMNLLYHIVFRPKNSAQVIVVDKEEMLYRYIWGFVENKKGVLYRIRWYAGSCAYVGAVASDGCSC